MAAATGTVDASTPTLLIHNGHVITNGEAGPLTPGWVLVAGSVVSTVGSGPPPPVPTGTPTIDASGSIVVPGLVNGHTHLEQSFMRGSCDDQDLSDWLASAIGPLQRAMTPDDVYLALQLGLLENLRFGVTSLLQHHKVTQSREHVDAALEAARRVGLRVRLARGWCDQGPSAEPPGAIVHETLRVHERCTQLPRGRVSIGFGPTWMPFCSGPALQRTAAVAREAGLFTHMHAAETRPEVDYMITSAGQRPVEWLATLGVLGPDVHLVHAVHVTSTELEQISASGSTVVHCPVSNAFLASGLAPLADMKARAVKVSLGTDGAASNNNQDVVQTARIAMLFARQATGNPAALTPHDALRLITEGGRYVFPDCGVGVLTGGSPADIAIFKLSTARTTPAHSPVSALINCAAGAYADTVIMDGRVVLEGGAVRLIDEVALLNDCATAAARLWRRAGIQPGQAYRELAS